MDFVVLLVNSLQFVIQFLIIGEEDFVEKMGGGLIGGLTDCPEYNLHESSLLLWRGTSWDALFGVVLFNFVVGHCYYGLVGGTPSNCGRSNNCL